jgi:hypothetical protein
MPIYTPSGFLDITNATLRTSNIESQNINFTGSGGSISVGPAYDFQQVSAIGNTTPETIQFTNATTSFVTSGNVEVGKNISVVDATVSSNMSVGGNVTVSSNLSVSGNVTIGKNLFLTSNTTASINSNVIVEHSGPHPREPTTPLLKKFPEIDFDASKMDGNDTANTYVQAGYVVTASSQSSGSEVWRLFDDGDWNQEAINKYTTASSFQYNPSSNSNSLGDVSGEWFKVKFPRKVIINKFTLNVGDIINNGLVAFKVLGSDDDTNWTEVKDVSGLTSASYTTAAPFVTTVESVSSEAYRYYAVVITQLLGVNQVTIREVEFYGYEEDLPAGDTSLDTTFTSILNRPQTSGVKVYVDGDTLDNKVTGPTPTSTGATYDSTGKYWSITSNVTVEANTFLEGDAPHSVSVWFNSSNLEANVSNTCVFSVSDQEHLNSENLDLQSNTWHNLTYAYQGEGGSRVTYLDGRKVSEDQAEDTFGDYPPFAMTGYSQGGYVVSSNHTRSGYYPYDAFDNETNDDDTTSSRWWSSADVFSGYVYNGSTSDHCGTFQGAYLKLELPYKLICSHVNLWLRDYNNGTTPNPQSPKNFKIVGSNDDINWVELKDEVNFVDTGNVSHPVIVNATKGYKYLAIVVTRVNSSTLVSIMDVEYYGHRENDLVRLPDPTRVLKYPHVALTGPAQRGYVASASSYYNNLDRYAGWNAFDETVDDPDGWVSYPGSYSSGTPSTYSGLTQPDKLTGIDATSSGGDTSRDGSWLKIEVPHKLRLSQMKLFRRQSSQRIVEGFIYGSNDNSTFYQISNNLSQITNIGTYSNTDPLIIIPTDTTTPFKHFVVQVTRNDATSTHTNVGEWQLYGTEEATPVPIQIGGGNIDRVANFRVYDKFVGEDQALEIWDAQKDTFRGVKNSMTLHKGYLGIGTEEPEGRLAILDEPHNLEEFPPRAMTDYETYFEGHGVFKASASSEQNTTTTLGWHVFAKVRDDINKRWRSNSNLYDNTVSPATTTSANATFDGIGVRGEWILLEMPYNICLKKYEFIGFTGQTPHTGQIWGSDDSGTTWHHVDTFQNAVGSPPSTYPNLTNTFHVLGNTKYYSKYVFIVEKLTSADDAASMSSLKYFGTREQRQSVLHDGQLTLTKNLDVPRIGPPLDADDTPRRDRLVVEYNTSTNPTFEGAVRDTSGRGFDGMFISDTHYDATEKSIKFNGSSDGVELYIKNPAGSWIHTFSFWVKPTETSTGETILQLGNHSASDNSSLRIENGTTLRWFFHTNDITYTNPLIVGSWYHVVAAYDGGSVAASRRLWVNGIEIAQAGTQTPAALTLPENARLRLGYQSGGNHFGGSISNFKLYDVALTAQEVKTLYDMGRNGSVANPQPLHIAAPLYAPGSIVQVEQSIKRDDSSTSGTSASDIPGLSVTIHPKFGTSKILVSYQINMGGNYHMFLKVKRTQNGTTTYIGLGDADGNRPRATSYQSHFGVQTVEFLGTEILDPANGTDPITYQVQFWVAHTSYVAYINRSYDNYNNVYGPGALSSSITVKEVCQ